MQDTAADAPGSPMDHAGTYASGGLAGIAKAAVVRSRSEPRQALVAIVFSAAAAEAFLADLDQCARVVRRFVSEVPEEARALGAVPGDVRVHDVRLRYQLARIVVARAPFDEGAEPWQGFRTLVHLRNEIAHHKPERFYRHGRGVGEIGKAIGYLERRGVIQRPPPAGRVVWSAPTHALADPAVAAWAYAAACTIVDALVDAVPRSFLWQLVHGVSTWAREAQGDGDAGFAPVAPTT